ncbi:hypothetical protein RYA05_05665 [Pseudomonas syringae pv. actinidiae]|nr:hypothetical protein [Pseudomonas syringae pv. actinidiae]
MSLHTLVHNGKIAKSWAERNFSKVGNQVVKGLLSDLCGQETPRAEVRQVIHQRYGQATFFNIEIASGKNPEPSFIRGYLLADRSVRDIRQISSLDLADVDEGTINYLEVMLEDPISDMLPSFAGNKILPSHLDSLESAPLSLPNENDWEVMRQMVMANPYIDRLSSSLLDHFDLHPAQTY